MADRPLYGPVCPCGKPFRRRSYWARWDRETCRDCGRQVECIEAGGAGARFNIGSPETTAQRARRAEWNRQRWFRRQRRR